MHYSRGGEPFLSQVLHFSNQGFENLLRAQRKLYFLKIKIMLQIYYVIFMKEIHIFYFFIIYLIFFNFIN